MAAIYGVVLTSIKMAVPFIDQDTAIYVYQTLLPVLFADFYSIYIIYIIFTVKVLLQHIYYCIQIISVP